MISTEKKPIQLSFHKFITMKYFNLIAYFAMIGMNYLAATLPLNNTTTGQVSNQYPTLFTPAGIAFSIWSVIYLLMFIFLVVQLFDKQKANTGKIGWYFVLSCFFNIGWLFAWHYHLIGLSTLIMFLLLVSLLIANRNLSQDGSRLAKAAFGIYLGWICVAAIANVSIFLVSLGWNGFGIPEPFWAAFMILATVVLTGIIVLQLKNPFLALSVVWGLTGIFLARLENHPVLAYIAAGGVIIIVATTIILFSHNKKKMTAKTPV